MFSSPLGAHPIFSDVARHVSVDKLDRVEMSTVDMDPLLVEQALAVTIPCCRCGKSIHPFRRRRSTPERAAPSTGPVYVSLVCPMAANPGCARGKAADAAKAALIYDVTAAKASAQPGAEKKHAREPEWIAEFLEQMHAGLV